MSDNAPVPPAKHEPLFVLDLGENGGHFAPTSYEELIHWIQDEQSFWTWTGQRNYGNHQQGQQEARSHLINALTHATQAQQHVQSNPQHAQQQLDACRARIEDAFLRQKLPHSSTPLAKRVDAFRKEMGDQSASYFLAVIVSPQNGQSQFQPQELSAWRGLIEGMLDRFQLVATIPKGRKQAAEQSFEQLRGEAEKLLDEKTTVYDALHRDYEVLAGSIRTTASEHATEFDTAQQTRQAEFEKLSTEHQQGMESLRKAFREEMALRAPAEYWTAKRSGHRFWAVITGALSFLGIAVAAGLIGWQVHDLLKNTPQGTTPETWRLAVLALIGIFTVWGLRLLVRMFLSHLHLLTDAGERIVMVQTYLSLLEGNNLDSKEDRQLILQALFRPASDGIVKDEGVPFSLAEFLTRTGNR